MFKSWKFQIGARGHLVALCSNGDCSQESLDLCIRTPLTAIVVPMEADLSCHNTLLFSGMTFLDTAAKWTKMSEHARLFRGLPVIFLFPVMIRTLLQQRMFQFCVLCNQKARVSEVRLVLLKGFETCCTHTLCIKGLVLTTKVKISSEPLVLDLIAWLVLDAAR